MFVQVLTSVAQAADLMAPVQRAKPLHIVAESRGPLLEEFADRLHILRAQGSTTDQGTLLTTDVLPTEDLCAGARHATSCALVAAMLRQHKA
jgi:hypothetical protein